MKEPSRDEQAPRAAVLRLGGSGAGMSPRACFVVGSVFALIDALTTWYALRHTILLEANPAARWAFDRFGLAEALTLRVVLGCGALAVLAWGMSARVGRHERIFNVGCRVVLTVALVLWGMVAVSNSAQILYVHVRLG